MIFTNIISFFADALTPPPDIAGSGHGYFSIRGYLLLAYGIILLIGGIIGYVKAKSLPSLIAGGISGIIAIGLSFIAANTLAMSGALALSIILILMMGRRYLVTKKPMPALLIVALSSVVALVQIYLLLKRFHIIG